MNEENDSRSQLNARIHKNVAQELRQLVIQRHGKLSGSLREEIEEAIRRHIVWLKELVSINIENN